MLYDGNISFAGGQNGGILADRIQADQYAAGVNVSTRNGALSPRLRFVQVPLRFRTNAEHVKYWPLFRQGKFQCACYYRSSSGSFHIVVISGLIFAVDPLTGKIQHVPIDIPSGQDQTKVDTMHPRMRRINFAIAGRFLVLFDWSQQRPIIMDGLKARRSASQSVFRTIDHVTTELIVPEVPPSRLGTFVQNRLFIGNDAHEFGAGDPVGGLNADAPITFEESLAPSSQYNGQFFSLGTTNVNNPITYMGYLQTADTSTGYGPLVVATDNSLYTFAANQPRSEWENGQFGSLSLYNGGVAGPRAAVNVNSDLLFVSGDGQIRSLNMGRADQAKWANSPMSREVSNWIVANDPSLVRYSVAASFGNMVFFTVNPFLTKAVLSDGTQCFDVAFRGMVVMELDNVSGLGQNARPAWAGLWQGICPMEICNGIYDGSHMLHVWSKDPGSVNNLYNVTNESDYDVFEEARKPVVSRLYTRLFDFDARFKNKRNAGADIKLTNIEGANRVDLRYRGSINGNFAKWREFFFGVKTNCEGREADELPSNHLPGSIRELHFGSPSEAICDAVTNEQGDFMRTAQLRLTISGANWMIEDLRLTVEDADDSSGGRISERLCPTGDALVYADNKPPCPVECEPTEDDFFTGANDWMLHSVPTRDPILCDPRKPCEPCTPPQAICKTPCDPCLTN